MKLTDFLSHWGKMSQKKPGKETAAFVERRRHTRVTPLESALKGKRRASEKVMAGDRKKTTAI